MTALPIQYQWDGEAMVPASRFWAREADKQFVVGQRYRMAEEHDRSTATHNHEFAFIASAWDSFPDELKEQFPSPEHLRKFGLIRKGFCITKQYAFPSAAEAKRFAAGLSEHVDEYTLVVVDRGVVTVSNAMSQSKKAMGKERFQASKQALLEYVAEISGIEPEALAA